MQHRDLPNPHKVLIDIAKYDCLYVTYKSDSFCNNVINYRGNAGQNVQDSEKNANFCQKDFAEYIIHGTFASLFEKE